MRRARRGQGTLELAFGLTVLVPTLMLGWSFAESSYAGIKVTEAAESALWDASQGGSGMALDLAAADATRRYANYDGRKSKAGGVKRVGVSSTHSGLTVTCGAGPGLSISAPALLLGVILPPATASCSARGETSLFGSFTQPHCSTGRPDGWFGPCAGGKALAYNEGHLRNNSACTVSEDARPCENGEYDRKVRQLYTDTGGAQGAAARDLLYGTMGGNMPLYARDALGFYLSFQGEDAPGTPFAEEVRHRADGEGPRWDTTPFGFHPEYSASWGTRTRCYLGAYCDSPSIDRP